MICFELTIQREEQSLVGQAAAYFFFLRFVLNKSVGSDCCINSAILTIFCAFFLFVFFLVRCTSSLNCYKVFTFSSRSPTKRLTCSTLRGLLHPTLRSSLIYV